MPTASLLVVVVAFACSPVLSGKPLQPFDVYNALQGFAQLGLLALAIGITMIAGEFDLSVVGTYALGGMLAVPTGAESPVLGVLAAVAAGAAIGAVAGWAHRAAAHPVDAGHARDLHRAARPDVRDVGRAEQVLPEQRRDAVGRPDDRRDLLAAQPADAGGVRRRRRWCWACTKLGRELRAIGGDRRASRVAGVSVDRRIVGLFTASGTLAALGGALLSYSYASANPDPGLQPLILAAVAALLGGVSLAGGRGAPLGLLAGTLSVALLAQIVAVTALPDFTTQLLYAALLAVIVAIGSAGLHATLDRLRASRTDRLPSITGVAPPVDARPPV